MATMITIMLDFDHDDVSEADVYNYLNELMEDQSLGYYKEVYTNDEE